jgi:hypothetical protein
MPLWLLPTLTATLSFVFSIALLDQWRERHGAFQLAWAIGMLLYGIGAGRRRSPRRRGWSDPLYAPGTSPGRC